ncbi:MAG: hypothetical protein V1701_02655 [Planctomycetota bacterium]
MKTLKETFKIIIALALLAGIIYAVVYCVGYQEKIQASAVLYRLRVTDGYGQSRELIYGENNNLKGIEFSISRDGGKNWEKLWKK